MRDEVIPAEEINSMPEGRHVANGLGGAEAGFTPPFEEEEEEIEKKICRRNRMIEEILEDPGECELAGGIAGRRILFFRSRRSGRMPESADPPVKD